MKIFDLGSSVRVMVPRQEVYQFSRKYPGSDLPDKNISFIFDKKTGDIEEIFPRDIDGSDVEALSKEAWEFFSKNKKQAFEEPSGEVVVKYTPEPEAKPRRRKPSFKNKSNRSDYIKNYMQEYRKDKGKDYQKLPDKAKAFRRKQRKRLKKKILKKMMDA